MHEVHTTICRTVKAHSFPIFSLHVAYLHVTQKAMEKGCCMDVDAHTEKKKSLQSILKDTCQTYRYTSHIELSVG